MEELDIKKMFLLIWKKKILIIIVMLISIVVGISYNKLCVKKIYLGTTSVILTKTTFEKEADVEAYSKLVDRYTMVANSREVAREVIKNLKLDMNLAQMQASITVTPWQNAYCIIISVQHENNEMAAKIADEVTTVFIKHVNKIYGDENLQILEPAIINDKPENDSILKDVIKFAIIGMFLVGGYILIIYLFGNNNDSNSNETLEKKRKIV